MGAGGGRPLERTVTLDPGKAARAMLREIDVTNFPASACTTTSVGGLRVYPPGETVPTFVPNVTKGCAQRGRKQLGVGFVVPAPPG